MATKLKVNYEFVGDSTTPVTRTESIKHGDKMLNGVLNDLEYYVTPQMFGAVGDGIHDDTIAIQSAINSVTNTAFSDVWEDGERIYKKGGGTVFFPKGKYRITDTIIVGEHCRLLGCSTNGWFSANILDWQGAIIIADFDNWKKWMIDSAVYNKNTGERMGYRSSNGQSALWDDGIVNGTHGIKIENLFLRAKNDNVYGGIRLLNSPDSSIRGVSIYGTDIGIHISASWDTIVDEVQTATYLYGLVSNDRIDSAVIKGYFNRIPGKTINDENRVLVYDGDFDTSSFGEDIRYKTVGLFLYYQNGIALNGVMTESWDIANVYVACNGIVNNGGYVENCKTNIAINSSRACLNGIFCFAVQDGYLFGKNSVITLDNCPALPTRIYFPKYTDIKIICKRPDDLGWKYDDCISFVGSDINEIRVSSDGNVRNIANENSYTTLSEAFRRISASTIRNWTIIIKDGETVEFSDNFALVNKNVMFVKESNGTNPKIKFKSLNGYMKFFELCGRGSISFDAVDLECDSTNTYTSYYDRGMFCSKTNNSCDYDIKMVNNHISLGNGWSLTQPLYRSTLTTNITMNNCTVTGTGDASFGSTAYENECKTIVSFSGINCTLPSAITTKGFENSHVIYSSIETNAQ